MVIPVYHANITYVRNLEMEAIPDSTPLGLHKRYDIPDEYTYVYTALPLYDARKMRAV